jgi:hypothetical protein
MKKILLLIICIFLITACNTDTPEIIDEQLTIDDEQLPEIPILSDFEKRLAALEPFEPRTEIIRRYHPYPAYELIPGDYGKLYPFPAYAESGWNILHGLITADGRIVADGMFDMVNFIDLNDGYYIMERMTPHEALDGSPQWINTVMTANGSRSFSTPNYVTVTSDGNIRVFERRFNGDESLGEFVGVVDFDGNIISPFVHESEFLRFEIGTARRGYSLYVNRETHEVFSDMREIILNPESVSVIEIENNELNLIIKHGHQENLQNLSHIPGVIIQINDNLFLSHRHHPTVEWRWESFAEDKDGNVLLNLADGYRIIGNLIVTWNPNRFYDFDLNKLTGFEEYGFVSYYVGNDVYTFWDADGVMRYVNILTGEVRFNEDSSLPGFDVVWGQSDGLSQVFHNHFMGVVNSDGEWVIKIDMLKTMPD